MEIEQTSATQSIPQNQIVIEPQHGWISIQLRALWQYRELLYFLVWHNIKVRYKQTELGDRLDIRRRARYLHGRVHGYFRISFICDFCFA